MHYDYLVFDLDGTLSDPKAGFVNSANTALSEFGYPPIEDAAADACIGPPLDSIFRRLTGSADAAHLSALIHTYREAYARTGYAENSLYPGVAGLLDTLSTKDVGLAVCTSKRVDFAESILDLHRIRHYFAFVDGADVGLPKWKQLQVLLEKRTLSRRSVMIGDRDVDLIAAHRNGLDSAGVLWGYGSRRELMRENPTYLFETPGQLVELAPL